VAVVGVLNMLNVAAKTSPDPLRRKQALLLAEGLMEEVQLAAFTYCEPSDINVETSLPPSGTCAAYENAGRGANASANRPYDNVNDYVTAYGAEQNSFNNGGATLRDAAGNVLAGDATHLPGYSATLTITPTDSLNDITSTATPATTNVLRISVKVNYGTGPDDFLVLDGYRTRYAPTVPAQ
jgi:MSHA pilin protein MshD